MESGGKADIWRYDEHYKEALVFDVIVGESGHAVTVRDLLSALSDAFSDSGIRPIWVEFRGIILPEHADEVMQIVFEKGSVGQGMDRSDEIDESVR